MTRKMLTFDKGCRSLGGGCPTPETSPVGSFRVLDAHTPGSFPRAMLLVLGTLVALAAASFLPTLHQVPGRGDGHAHASAADAMRTGVPRVTVTATSTVTVNSTRINAVRVTATTQAHRITTAQAVTAAESTRESRVRRTATAQSRATDWAEETATAHAVPVDGVEFVADVTVPDNTALFPGEPFEKTWLVRNTGSGDWPADYQLRFVSGSRLGAEQGDFVPVVSAGKDAEITVPMSAPDVPGSYSGMWRVVDAEGEPVGEQLLSVVIQVPEPTMPPTPSVDFVVIKQDVLPVFMDGGCNWQHNIYVTVIDKYGNPLDGLVLGDTYDNVELVTGSKGPGRCDFDLWANTLELYIKRDEAGTPYRSEVTRRLSSDHPEIGDMINGGVCREAAECQDKMDRFSYCWGHYAYEVVFQRTW